MTTITEALRTLQASGTDVLEIYFAELIEDGETEWSVDVMCDPINDLTGHSWTWSIVSLAEVTKAFEDDDYFVCADWEIITNLPFCNKVVSDAINDWLTADAIYMTSRVIDVEDAAGSGCVRELRNMDLEWETNNSTPLVTSMDERDENV